MRAPYRAAAHLLLLIAALALPGCDRSGSSDGAQPEFAVGAFPPTLSNEDYHTASWKRTDCLTCHEQGFKDSPVMRHVSLPELAKDSKCRTCHVLLPDQKASD